jgi:hypothetical protein
VRIQELCDWRGETLAKVRRLIKEANPEVIEEWKWVKPTNPGTSVWFHKGGICTEETYKSRVKLTFFKGASLEDPSHLFNQPGTVRRPQKYDLMGFGAVIDSGKHLEASLNYFFRQR